MENEIIEAEVIRVQPRKTDIVYRVVVAADVILLVLAIIQVLEG